MSAQALVYAAAAYSIDLVGSVHADTNWQARQNQGYAAAYFTIDWQTKNVVCPQGHSSTYWREYNDHTGQYVIDVRWSWKVCKICPVVAQCSQKQQGSRTIQVHTETAYRALHAARHRQTTDAFRMQDTQRAGIEGTLGHCIRRSGLRSTRSIGLKKTHLQHLCTATARNVVRVVDHLAPGILRKPDKSSFSKILATGT